MNRGECPVCHLPSLPLDAQGRMQFGEPLAEWVGEQATRYGIDTEGASAE